MRRWLTIAVILVVVLVIGIGAATWWIAERVRPWLTRERLETMASEALGRPVTVERVSLQPWLGRVGARGVRLSAAAEPGAGPALAVGRIEVAFGIASLWRRELVLSRIRLDDVDLRVVWGGSAEPWSLPERIPDRFQLGPITVVLERVEVRRGRLHLGEPGTGRSLEADGLELHARLAGDGLDASVSARALWVTVPGLAARHAGGTGATSTGVLEHFRAEGKLRGTRVSLAHVEGRWQGQVLRVAGDLADLGARPTLILTVRGAVPVGAVVELLGSPLPADGIATVDATVRGPSDAPAVVARVRVPALTVDRIQARKVSGQLAWSDGALRVTEVTAEALGGEVRGSVWLAPAKPDDARMTFVLSSVAVTSCERLLASSPSGLGGHISGDGEITGDLRDLAHGRGRVRLESADLTLPGLLARLGPGRVSVAARLERGDAEITSGSAQWHDGRVEGVGGQLTPAGPRGLRGLVTADLGRLGRRWNESRVSGEATVAVTLEGRWDALVVEGRARSSGIGVGGVRLGALDLPFRLSGAALSFDEAQALLGQSRVIASGRLQAPSLADLVARAGSVALDLDVRAPSARVEDLGAWIPQQWPVTGTFAATARATGTIAAWRVAGRLDAAALGIGGQTLERVEARLALDPHRVELLGLQASVVGVPVRGTGTWSWDGTGRAAGEVGPLSVAGVALGQGTVEATIADRVVSTAFAFPGARLSGSGGGRLGAGQPIAARLAFQDLALTPLIQRAGLDAGAVNGVASGHAELTFPFWQPERASGVVRLDGLRVEAAGDAWRNQGPVVFQRRPGVTSIEQLGLVGPTGVVAASGTVSDRLALDLKIRGRMPLAVLPALSAEVKDAGGVLEASVEVTGAAATPDVGGSGTIREGRVTLRRFPGQPVTALRADFTLSRQRVRITDAAGVVAGVEARASGDVVWQRPAPRLDLRVRGRLPLAVLTAGRTEVREAEGFVNLDARVTGTTAAPDFTGEGTVSDGHLAFRDYPDSLRALRGRFTISPQALRVAELTASLGGGEVRARGDLALRAAGVGAYRFTIGARGVAMEMFDGFASTWNADLELVGHEARSQLRGDAHLVRGLYTTETPLLRLLLTRQGAARAAGPPGGLPLDIRVHLDDNLAARTSFARARADGTLTIGGTTDAPIVFGTLVAREGHVMFRNQRFTFVAASVRFADPRRIDPTLDVHAQARIRNHDVTLLIRGRTEELEIRASSVPTLPEEDVLSLIAFGQTRAQLGRGGGLGAGGAFAGQAAGLLIEDLFGLEGPGRIVDVVDVETAEDTTRTVTVGKRVTERTLVLYSQGVEKSQERKLRIEYEVVGPLVVAGEQDFRGGFGGDVLVRLRFR